MSIKKISLLVVICFSTILFNNNFAIAKNKSDKDELYNQIEIFSDAISAIQHDYVDIVPPKEIIYGALKGMLASLDPYSQFMDPDSFKELQVETEGEFGGLGIEITLRDNLLTIITPLDGTPADFAGLKAMDRIVKIDDTITKDITLTEAVKLMRGKPSTDVTLTIMRDNEDKLLDFTITRDIIEVKAVRNSQILEDNIGYIKLTDFSEKTKSDLDAALKQLEKEGMDSLIFDLRNNPGGLLISSVETASEFLPTGEMIVYTKGREENQNTEFRATGKSNYKDIPLIVMVNSGSASASEIVAGAIQDHKRGIILGTTSFGKGSVQTVIPLRDGSALRLTTAKYYTPSGRTINEVGVVPDVTVEFEQPKEKKIEQVKKDKEVFDKIENDEKAKSEKNIDLKEDAVTEQTPTNKDTDETKDKDTDKDKNKSKDKNKEQPDFIKDDNQLRAAINLMRGIKIYTNLKKSD
ncbi:MAG: S41 family peptidase [Candidatus Omnitrophica bacterium]|nr:S41 family peptidase [Candidatus Omnitrophota bacterium]